ncbi:MAG: hypothetical protein V4650_03215 [Pseudomonadota bacterium]
MRPSLRVIATLKRLSASIGFALLLALPLHAGAATPAGKVVMLTGQATAVGAGGTVRKLARNDEIFAGDLINSGFGSYVNLRFADGAFFLLRPETRFEVEDYEYAPPASAPAAPVPAATPTPVPAAPAGPAAAPLVTAQTSRSSTSSRAFFRLIKGGFRSVSGLIGKISTEDYRVSTPVATIGIRGTKYSASLCEGACTDRNEISALLQQAGAQTTGNEVVLVTEVEDGQIAIQAPGGSSLQGPGTVLFTTEVGVPTPVQQAPKSVRQDSDLKPEACGG